MSHDNPYQAPAESGSNDETVKSRSDEPVASFHLGRLDIFILLYPILLVGLFYVTWLVAWALLGHQPRPMLDDPKNIGGAFDALYILTGLMLIGFFAVGIVGTAYQLKHQTSIPIRILRATLVFAWSYVVLMFLRWDPHRIMEWYMD